MENCTLIKDMTSAAKRLRGSGLNDLNEIEPLVKTIMKKVLLSTREETLLLIAMTDRQCSGKSSTIGDLSDYFKCSAMEIMPLTPAMKSLLKNGYITAKGMNISDITKAELSIPPEVFDSIIEDKEVCATPQQAVKEFDQYSFCYAIYEAIKRESSFEKLIALVEQLESEHSSLALIKELKAQVSDISARLLFYFVCRNFCENKEITLRETIKAIYGNDIKLGTMARSAITTEKHPLVKAELIGLKERDSYNRRKDEPTVQLMEKGIELFFGDTASAYLKPCRCTDRFEFVRRTMDIWDKMPHCPNTQDFRCFYAEIERMEQSNAKLSFIENIKRLVSETDDRFLFYCVCDSALDNNSMDIWWLSRMYSSSKERTAKRDLKKKRHILQKQNLVELGSASFFGDSTLTLTEKGKELFFEKDIDMFEEKIADKDLIICDSITEKKLFFEPSLERQLSTLRETFLESNLISLRERLKNSSLPMGIAVLLYGLPGTGKTESVMQIAHATGRSIMHVDISQTKSHWFGDSEKIIKEVFNKYRKLCKKSTITPILLFNEADAVFSKRKDTNSSNVAQTENAIQNIILEEMENLDGILVATTNLADNLDKAFERRFLFKIRFDKPALESKICIWKDKLPRLSDEDAAELAREFDFSGGEIDNIVRKIAVEEVVSGNVPNIERIAVLCQEEKIATRRTKFGF